MIEPFQEEKMKFWMKINHLKIKWKKYLNNLKEKKILVNSILKIHIKDMFYYFFNCMKKYYLIYNYFITIN